MFLLLDYVKCVRMLCTVSNPIALTHFDMSVMRGKKYIRSRHVVKVWHRLHAFHWGHHFLKERTSVSAHALTHARTHHAHARRRT